jgi:HEAT repeat protein
MNPDYRSQLEKLLQDSLQQKIELAEELRLARDSIERDRYQRQIVQTEADITRFEVELGQLPHSLAVERQYLKNILNTYSDLGTHYTELRSNLTLDQSEKRRHSALVELLSHHLPPDDRSSAFLNPLLSGEIETRLPGPILQQVALLPVAAILGAPGAGKSFTLRRLALHYAQMALDQTPSTSNDPHAGKIPLLIPLGGYDGSDLLDYARTFLSLRPNRRQFDYVYSSQLAARLETLLEAGRLLLMFDALNEVSEQYRPAAYAGLKQLLLNYCSPNQETPNTFLLTCRDADYTANFTELPRLVLQPLDDPTIAIFLQNYFPHEPTTPTAIQSALDANQGQPRHMVRNPYFLKIVVDLYTAGQPIPQTRGELLQAFHSQLLDQVLTRASDSLDKTLLTDLLPGYILTASRFETLPPDLQTQARLHLAGLLNPFLAQLAFAMFSDASQGTETTRAKAFQILPSKSAISLESYDAEGDLRTQFIDRSRGKLLQLAALGGFISLTNHPESAQKDRLRYGHQLLQEYFAAAYLLTNTTEEWKVAAHSYDFDEVLPFFTDLSPTPAKIIQYIQSFDLRLAARCAGLLPNARLDPTLRDSLLTASLALLNTLSTYDLQVALDALTSLRAIPQLLDLLNNADSWMRLKAIEALKELNAKEATSQLLKWLTGEDTQLCSNAMEALIALNAKESIPPLLQQLKDENSKVRSKAIQALRELGTKEAISPLLQHLKDEDSNIRSSVVETLKELGAKEVIPQLPDLLTDEDSWVRLKAIEAMVGLGAKEYIPQLIERLTDPDRSVRSSAVQALKELNVKEAVPQLVNRLTDLDSQVRSSATEALVALEARAAIPQLLEWLTDFDNQACSSAIQILGELDVKEAISQIIKCLTAKDNKVRFNAVQALIKLKGDSSISDILPMLQDQDSDVRSITMQALVDLTGNNSIPYLRPLLQDKYWRLRSRTMAALIKLEGSKAIPYLRPLLQDHYERMRLRAVQIFTELGDSSIVPDILPLLQDKVGFVRSGAMEALVQLGAGSLSQTLSLLQDADSLDRSKLLGILAKLGDSSAVLHILPLLQNTHHIVRSTAIRTIGELADRSTVDLLTPFLTHPNPTIHGEIKSLREKLKRRFRLPKDY